MIVFSVSLGNGAREKIGLDVVRRKEREDRLAEARGVRGRALADRHVALGRVAGVDAVDVDDVAAAIDREMDAQARAQHQVAQVGPRLHRDAQRARRRAAQLEHLETELIPARARVLLDVSGLHQRREQAMANADGQLQPLRDLGDRKAAIGAARGARGRSARDPGYAGCRAKEYRVFPFSGKLFRILLLSGDRAVNTPHRVTGRSIFHLVKNDAYDPKQPSGSNRRGKAFMVKRRAATTTRLRGRRRAAKARSPCDSSRSDWGRSPAVPAPFPGRRPAHSCSGDENGNPAGYWRDRPPRPGG